MESLTAITRNILVRAADLGDMVEGQESIGIALSDTFGNALLDMAEMPIAQVLLKAPGIDGRSTALDWEVGANAYSYPLGALPIEGPLPRAALRRCTDQSAARLSRTCYLRTGLFRVRPPSSVWTAMPRPPELAFGQEIGAITGRPDLGITQHEVRSTVLRWQTGASRSSCRHGLGPMPRQTNCGRCSTPPAMALGRDPSHVPSARAAGLTHPLAMR